jgi:hypothetical protein
MFPRKDLFLDYVNKNTMQKIIILDFITGEVHVFPFDENIMTCEEFFELDEIIERGIEESNSQYMVTDANIIIHSSL